MAEKLEDVTASDIAQGSWSASPSTVRRTEVLSDERTKESNRPVYHDAHEPPCEGISFWCLGRIPSFEELRKMGSSKLRSVKATAKDTYSELRTLLSPEHAVDRVENDKPQPNWVSRLAGGQLCNTFVGMMEEVKRRGIQVRATVQSLHRSAMEQDTSSSELHLNGTANSAHQEAFDSDSSDIEIQENDVEIKGPSDDDVGSGPGELQPGTVRENSAGEVTASHRPLAAIELLTTQSNQRARFPDSHLDDTEKVKEIKLRRSIPVRKECYYCHTDVGSVEICIMTKRFVCQGEQCQSRLRRDTARATTEVD